MIGKGKEGKLLFFVVSQVEVKVELPAERRGDGKTEQQRKQNDKKHNSALARHT